ALDVDDACPGTGKQRRGEAGAAILLSGAADDDLRARVGIGVIGDVRQAALAARGHAVLPARLWLEGAGAAAAAGPHRGAVPGRGGSIQRGAAHRHHVLRRGRPARGDAAVAALVGAGIAGGDREGLALRHRLLEDLVLRRGRAVALRAGLALAQRHVDDLGRVGVDDGVEVGGEVGVGQGRDVVEDQAADLAAGHADDILAVQAPLAQAAGVAAGAVGVDGLGGDRGQTVLRGERVQVGDGLGDLALGDDAYRYA